MTLDTQSLTSGSATFDTSALEVGDHEILVTYSGDGTYIGWADLFIQQILTPVEVTNPGPQSNYEGDTGTPVLAITATDSVFGSTLVYAASGLPAGLYIDPDTGEIEGTVAIGAATYGPYTTTVTASDGTYSDTATFIWNVASPITLVYAAPTTYDEGDTITTFSPSTATDATLATLSFAAINLPRGLMIDTATGDITGTVAVGAAGSYTVTITASDDTYSASVTLNWTITNPVSITPLPDRTDFEGDNPTVTVNATDTSLGTLVYAAYGLPPGYSIDTGTGSITGTLAPGDSDYGPYFVTVVANDGDFSAHQSFRWFVKNPIVIATPSTQTIAEGGSASLTITATDAALGTVVFGAVGLPAGLSIDYSTGAITGTVDGGAAEDGPYIVTLYAADGTYRATSSFTWNVTVEVSLSVPDGQTNEQGDAVSGLFATAINTGGGSLTYSATALPTGLSINSSTGEISGTITVAGSYKPNVTVTNSTDSISDSFFWAVSGPISISDPGTQFYNAGDAATLAVQAAGGGTLSYAAAGLPTGLSLNSSTGIISGTISSGLSAGVYHATITVDDSTNTTVESFAWVIAPVGDVVITNPGDQGDAEGSAITPLSLSASYSGGGTLVYSATGLPAGLSIDPTTGDITGTIASGASLFGPYLVVTATDGTDRDSQAFVWTATSPLTLANPGLQSDAEVDTPTLSLSASYGGLGTLSYAAVCLPAGLALDPATGDVVGTIAVGAAGSYTVTVVASADEYVATQTFEWTVGTEITLTNPGDQTDTEGDTPSLSLTTSYTGGGSLSFAAEGLPAGLVIDPTTGDITGTLAVGTGGAGPYYVTVVAQDGTTSVAASFQWTVNSPVTIDAVADQDSHQGDIVSLMLTANDTTLGTLHFAAIGLPTGLVIDADTGEISGTIADDASGYYRVTVGANDDIYSTALSFAWYVSSPVTIDSVSSQTYNDGDTVLVTVTGADATLGTITWSAADLPSGLSINSGTGAITGTLSAGGSWAATITADDGTYSATSTIYWSVGSPIVITDPGYQSNTVGDAVSLALVVSDNSGGTLSFSSTTLPSGLSINSSTGVISGTVGSGADVSSPYTITVTATSTASLAAPISAVDTFTWFIRRADVVQLTDPGDRTSAAGDMLALALRATDSDVVNAGSLRYTVSGLPAGLHYNPQTGLIFGTIADDADTGSPYSVTVVADDGTNSDMQTFDWTVNAAATVTLVNPGDQTNDAGDIVSIPLAAVDTGLGTLHFVAFGLPTGLSIDADTGDITGTVALSDADSGSYVVTLVANDGTYSAAQSFLWRVHSPVLSIDAIDDQTGTEADSVLLSLTSTYTGGNTVTFAATGLPTGLSIDPATGDITGTIAAGAADYGTYYVTILAGDGVTSDTQNFYWTISNPITITAPDTQSNVDGDTAISLTIDAVDATLGTLSFSAFGLPAGLSIDAGTGEITGDIEAGAANIGSFSPTIIVSNGTTSALMIFEWEVNSPISMDLPDLPSLVEGNTVTAQVSATDSTLGTLTYTAAWLPPGLTLDSATGAIMGTLTADAAAIGFFATLITVADGTYSESEVLYFTVAAAGPVTLATPANQSDLEGDTIATLSLTAGGSGTLTFFAEGLPPGLVMDCATGDITGTLAVNDAAYGPFHVTVLATNGPDWASTSFTWTVDNPVLGIDPIANQMNTEDGSGALSPTTNYTGGGTVVYAAVGLPTG